MEKARNELFGTRKNGKGKCISLRGIREHRCFWLVSLFCQHLSTRYKSYSCDFYSQAIEIYNL